jgi:hypothetical protein
MLQDQRCVKAWTVVPFTSAVIFAAWSAMASGAHAQSAPTESAATRDHTVSVTHSYFSSSYDRPGYVYKSSGRLTNLVASKNLDGTWTAGVRVSYSEVDVGRRESRADYDVQSWNTGGFLTWNNGWGLDVTGFLSYGDTATDNVRYNTANQRVFYQTDSYSLGGGINLTQFFPVTNEMSATVSVQYARYMGQNRGFTDPGGRKEPSLRRDFAVGALQTVLYYRLGAVMPFAGASVSKSTSEVVDGATEKIAYGYSAGAIYRFSPSTSLNASYEGVAGVRYLEDHRYTAGLSLRFYRIEK